MSIKTHEDKQLNEYSHLRNIDIRPRFPDGLVDTLLLWPLTEVPIRFCTQQIQQHQGKCSEKEINRPEVGTIECRLA